MLFPFWVDTEEAGLFVPHGGGAGYARFLSGLWLCIEKLFNDTCARSPYLPHHQ